MPVAIGNDVRLEAFHQEEFQILSARRLMGPFQECNIGVETIRWRETQRFGGNLDLEVRSHDGLEAVGAFVVDGIEIVLHQLQHCGL